MSACDQPNAYELYPWLMPLGVGFGLFLAAVCVLISFYVGVRLYLDGRS